MVVKYFEIISSIEYVVLPSSLNISMTVCTHFVAFFGSKYLNYQTKNVIHVS